MPEIICTKCNKIIQLKQPPKINPYICRKCKDKEYWQSDAIRKKYICDVCGLEYTRIKYRQQGKRKICRPCMVGPNNPSWKNGGLETPGKRSTDKQGLWWKTQKEKAHKRDNSSCRICFATNNITKIDCHHIVPYDICYSHAIDNLICLCVKHHNEIEKAITKHGFGLFLGDMQWLMKQLEDEVPF